MARDRSRRRHDGEGRPARARTPTGRSSWLARPASTTSFPSSKPRRCATWCSAGERQQSLDAARAAAYYRQAAALAPPGARALRDPSRRDEPRLAFRRHDVARRRSRSIEEPEREALEAGDRKLAARVLRRLYFQHGLRGETRGAQGARTRASPSSRATPLPRRSWRSSTRAAPRRRCSRGDSRESRRWADRALELPHTESVR